MGRKIRRVPANWKHPKKQGRYIPLYENYIRSLQYYLDNVTDFISKMTEVINNGETKIYDQKFHTPESVFDYCASEGELEPPSIYNYMPPGEWYQLYETVSEGTPLSPPFETKEELITWLSCNKDFWGYIWCEDGAKHIVETGFALSAIFTKNKIYTPEEQYLLANKNEAKNNV